MTTIMEHAPIQCLLSLPPSGVEFHASRENANHAGVFAACDPSGRKLGSGGGSAHMLIEGWRATGQGASFREWLFASRKLVVLGGGQSRRLPAYAAVGKPFIPMPVLQGSWGQRLDQTLLDLQIESFRGVLKRAPRSARVMIVSGDVLLHFADAPEPCPDVDLLMLGMEVDAEIACQFGVFFMPRSAPGRLAFMLQKPDADRIHELSAEHAFAVDTGMWLLSARAVATLLRRCGWDEATGRFAGGAAGAYELYSQFGLAAGERPTADDPEIRALSCGARVLSDPQFYHLGTSRQMIESACELQNRQALRRMGGATRSFPNQVIQNAIYAPPADRQAHPTLWIENATIPSSWRLARDHVITGVPDNAWDLRLEAGVCLDFVAVDEDAFCVRAYGMDDVFSGAIGDRSTSWLGRPAADWLQARTIALAEAAEGPATDIYQARLFPILKQAALDPRFVEWLFMAEPAPNPAFAELWRASPRLSAAEINQRANLSRAEAQRAAHRRRALIKMRANRHSNVFFRSDLDEAARLFAAGDDSLPPPQDDASAREPNGGNSRPRLARRRVAPPRRSGRGH
jgi:hypothetical protein